MAKFRVFNIQLLPDEEGVEEVGRAGYRKLFSELKKLNSSHLSAKTHAAFHYQLPADSFIGPKEFHFPSGYVYGNFVRYSKADEVTELRTGKTLFQKSKTSGAVTSLSLIPFVFDTDRHFLAIDGSGLPKAELFVEALVQYLQPVALDSFPKHTLTVNVISRANAIEAVFEAASAYKVVDLSVSFANGHATDELLKELKDSKTQQISLRASGGVKGRMTKIPEFVKDLLRAATSLGWSKITYFVPQPGGVVGALKKASFDSRDAPLTFTARHSSNDVNEADFFERVAEKLSELDVESPAEDEVQTEMGDE